MFTTVDAFLLIVKWKGQRKDAKKIFKGIDPTKVTVIEKEPERWEEHRKVFFEHKESANLAGRYIGSVAVLYSSSIADRFLAPL